MPDIALIIGLIMFSITGAPLDDTAACTVQDENSCLSSAQCDVFDQGGVATCEMACDERQSEAACADNSACSWTGGECTYAESAIPDC